MLHNGSRDELGHLEPERESGDTAAEQRVAAFRAHDRLVDRLAAPGARRHRHLMTQGTAAESAPAGTAETRSACSATDRIVETIESVLDIAATAPASAQAAAAFRLVARRVARVTALEVDRHGEMGRADDDCGSGRGPRRP